MAIIVFQHSNRGHPGRLGLTLRDHGCDLDIRRMDLLGMDGVPVDLDDVEGVVIMGGPQMVTDGIDWLDAECEFVREAHEQQLPVLGICLGAQLIAKALGGEVVSSEKPEWGFHRVTHTPDGHTHPVLAGIPWDTMMLQFHTQEVKTPPPGATVLQTGNPTSIQSFAVGLRTFACQYHPECDGAQMRIIAEGCRDVMAESGVDADEMLEQGDPHYDTYARLTDRLFVNLATFVFPVTRDIVA